MWIKILDYVLAGAAMTGHLVLLIVLIRRQLATRLPLFTILMAFYIVRSGVFLLAHLTAIGPRLSWVLIAFDPVLQLILFAAVIHAWRFFSFKSTAARTCAGFGLVIATCLSGAVAWYVGPSSHFSPHNLSIKAGIFVSILWIEAGLAQLALSEYRLPRLTQKVIWGFAVYSAANVLTEIGHRHFSAVREASPYLGLSYARVAVYLFCLLLWFIAFLREPRCAIKAPL
jgi:hypothetical protein